MLCWNGHLETVEYGLATHLPTIYTKEGNEQYRAYPSCLDHPDIDPTFTDNSENTNPNKQNKQKQMMSNIQSSTTAVKQKKIINSQHSKNGVNKQKHDCNQKHQYCKYSCPSNETGSSPNIPVPNLSTTQLKLLSWQNHLGHLDFHMLQQFATLGYLPKHSSKCAIPVCSGCQFGNAHKQYKTRTELTSITPDKTALGSFVSMDQMESTTPGHTITIFGKASKK